jgi:hypothetical protein
MADLFNKLLKETGQGVLARVFSNPINAPNCWKGWKPGSQATAVWARSILSGSAFAMARRHRADPMILRVLEQTLSVYPQWSKGGREWQDRGCLRRQGFSQPTIVSQWAYKNGPSVLD